MKMSDNPLSVLERIIGNWQVDFLKHGFTWGLNHQTLITKSYGPEGQLASEGFWFWHPGEKVVKGYSVAVAMPVNFFDYTLQRAEPDCIVLQLTSYKPGGEASEYIETWTFSDDDHYQFALNSITPAGHKRIMELRAERLHP